MLAWANNEHTFQTKPCSMFNTVLNDNDDNNIENLILNNNIESFMWSFTLLVSIRIVFPIDPTVLPIRETKLISENL